MTIKAITTVVTVMKILPAQINTSPIPATIANKNVFLKIRQKASLQATQKHVLAIAI